MRRSSRSKIKRFSNNKYSDMMRVYNAVFLVGLISTFIMLLYSHGNCFSSIFFYDSLDTGMDFFHSIEYTKFRAPYSMYNTLYPPLANFFFYLLFRMVPSWQYESWSLTFEEGVAARGSNIDLRVWQPTLFMFIIYTVLFSVLFIILVQNMMKSFEKQRLFALCILFSYGNLYALERGNIIFVAVICSLFFIVYRNSKNLILSELALIMLAIAAGLKLYPAFLGMLLIYDKDYKRALRTVGYGIIFFVFPVLIFKEGLSGIAYFIDIALHWSKSSELTVTGVSFDQICNTFTLILEKAINIEIDRNFLLNILPKFNLFVSALMLIGGFFLKKEWQRVLACCLAILMFQKQGIYIIAFLLLPLLQLVKDEISINKENMIPFFLLSIVQMMIPVWGSIKMSSYANYGRLQVCTILLIIYIVYAVINNIINRRYKRHLSCCKEI